MSIAITALSWHPKRKGSIKKMRPYFEKMDDLGKPLRPAQAERMQENAARAEAVMQEIDAEIERIRNVGIPAELPLIVPINQKAGYDFENILSRLVDNSEHLEFRPDFGPEVYTGLVKVDGFLLGAIGNRQGLLPGYPEYTNEYSGVGGKLYRQGLIKMNEFVTQDGPWDR